MKYYHMLPIGLASKLWPHLIWRKDGKENSVYLTFDDGPHPLITPAILTLLKRFGAKGTFFIVETQAQQYPEIVKQVLAEGHAIGGHSRNHDDPWKVSKQKMDELIGPRALGIPLQLYRPPYGHFTKALVQRAKQNEQEVIMWSKLSGDFDKSMAPTTVAYCSTRKLQRGDIIVFHDSVKADRSVLLSLRYTLEYCLNRGLEMKALI